MNNKVIKALISGFALLPFVEGLVFVGNATMDPFVSSKTYSQNATNEIEYSILAIVNYGGYYAPGPICTKAFEVGLEQLKRNGKLQNFNVKFELVDSVCDTDKMIRTVALHLADHHNDTNRLPIMLLDECSTLANVVSAKMLKPNHYVGLTTDFKSADLDFITKMTTFGLRPETVLYKKGEMGILLNMGWTKYAVFSEDLGFFNEIEREMFPMFEIANLELLYTTKVNFQQPLKLLSSEIEAAVIGLKKSDALIIFSHTDNPVAFACWLYKLDMIQNRVIIASAWSMWNPDSVKIPNVVSAWCTREMLRKAVKGWIFSTVGWMADVLGEGYVDDAGLTKKQFTDLMAEKIYTPSSWRSWAPNCYDLAYYTGLVIDETEQRLRMSSSSLMEWTVDGNNYLHNSSYIQNLILKSIYNVTFKGHLTAIDMDKKTHRNSDGWTPVVFLQMIKDKDGKFQTRRIAYFRYRDSKIVEINQGLQWATDDGERPVDRVLSISKTLSPTNRKFYFAFSSEFSPTKPLFNF